MNVLRLLIATVAIVAGTLLLMVIHDIIRPYEPIEVVIEPDMIILPGQDYDLSDDSDDWAESANALGIHPDSMTVMQFIDHHNQ